MSQNYSVTSAGVNPAQDRAHRMRMYFIAMTLRLACVTSLFWVRGWWILVAAAGAIILPWFAVMVGNAVEHGGAGAIDTPDPLELAPGTPLDQAPDGAQSAAAEVIVIDVEPTRRSAAPSAPQSSDVTHTTEATPE